MAKHNLIHLMNHSDLTVCNGYEIDNFWPDYQGLGEFPNQCQLLCGDDRVAVLPTDQEVEITRNLEVLPVEHNGDLYYFEFKVYTALDPADFQAIAPAHLLD